MQQSFTTTPHDAYEANCIAPGLFDKYAGEWLRIAANTESENDELAACFKSAAGAVGRLAAVSFPVERIAELLSAPRTHYVKARFLVFPADASSDKQPHFTIALFATDAKGTALTAYYLAEKYWELEPLAPDTIIPTVLGNLWSGQWLDPKTYPITPTLFASGGEVPLYGFNFEVSDFTQPLRALAELGKQRLLLTLGLHTYFGPGPEVQARTTTFGLILSMSGLTAYDGTDDPDYDMSEPCPPGL